MDSVSSGTPTAQSTAHTPGTAPTGPGPDPTADPATVALGRPADLARTENAPHAGADAWVGSTVRGRSGAIGKLEKVVDGPDGTPWGVVRPRLGGARVIPLAGAETADGSVTVPIDRRTLRSAPASDGGPDAALAHHYAGRTALTAAHEYQHERFGGFKVGSAFFGWLVAVGLTVLLAALASLVVRLAGVGPGLTPAPGQDPQMLGLVGGIVGIAVMLLAYGAGGYVAGRLARFDGARNGIAVWLMGVVVTVAVTIATAVTGTTDGLFAALRVPGIAVSTSVSAASAIALLICAAAALIGAIAGGKAGEGYHRRVDRAAEQAV